MRFEIGRGKAAIQCLLDNEDDGAFVWSGPAIDNDIEMGRTSNYSDRSGTISTLIIRNIVASDAGEYSCSYGGEPVSITLVVIDNSKLPYLSITTTTCMALYVWISH